MRPTRVAPIAIVRREDAGWLVDADQRDPALAARLSDAARQVFEALDCRGASFLSELVSRSGRGPREVEDALWELSAAGLVTADGFDNLRALIDPVRRRGRVRTPFRRPRPAAGRWALLSPAAEREPDGTDAGDQPHERRAARSARQLLARWGIVFRDVLARETLAPPWRDLLVAFRRMEARGDIRGGRFVAGFAGEQFARPDAIEALRAVRQMNLADRALRVAAADPLNLAGIITPGPRISPLSAEMVEVLPATGEIPLKPDRTENSPTLFPARA
jgi:ATP-dependent Lhr-like helicase